MLAPVQTKRDRRNVTEQNASAACFDDNDCVKASMSLIPVVLPVLFWAAYHHHKDRHLPEPPTLLLAAFALGIAAAGVSRVLYLGLDVVGLRFDAGYLADTTAAGLLAYCLLAIGPIEELAKLLPFVLVVTRFRAFDEPIDGIIYASFIGLGYAAIENWQYAEFLTTAEAAGRGFAAPVVHMLFASVWGYLVARAHVDGQALWPAAIQGYVAAALLHGIYDFAVLRQPASALPLAAALIAALWVWRLVILRRLDAAARSVVQRVENRRGDGP